MDLLQRITQVTGHKLNSFNQITEKTYGSNDKERTTVGQSTYDYLASPVSLKVTSWTHYNKWGGITHKGGIFLQKVKLMIVNVFILLICLSGCAYYRGPERNPNDLWVSENPPISFVALDEEKGYPTGEMMIDGELIEIEVHFDNGNRMDIYCAVKDVPYYGVGGLLISTNFVIRGDELTAHVISKKADIWEGFDEVTFQKKTFTPESELLD